MKAFNLTQNRPYSIYVVSRILLQTFLKHKFFILHTEWFRTDINTVVTYTLMNIII